MHVRRLVRAQHDPAICPLELSLRFVPASCLCNISPQHDPATKSWNRSLQYVPVNCPCVMSLHHVPETCPCNKVLKQVSTICPCELSLQHIPSTGPSKMSLRHLDATYSLDLSLQSVPVTRLRNLSTCNLAPRLVPFVCADHKPLFSLFYFNRNMNSKTFLLRATILLVLVTCHVLAVKFHGKHKEVCEPVSSPVDVRVVGCQTTTVNLNHCAGTCLSEESFQSKTCWCCKPVKKVAVEVEVLCKKDDSGKPYRYRHIVYRHEACSCSRCLEH